MIVQVESPDKIRNLAITGHNDTGKTTLASALLYAGGAVNRLNHVEDGNTLTDFDPEEIERTISIGLAPCFTPWDGHKINLVDCPGYGIFFAESRAGMRATDAALLCVNAVSGVEVVTDKAWDFAAKLDLPVMLHLTKMDRERADYKAVLASMRDHLDRRVTPIQIPIGKEENFTGVVDLIGQKAYTFTKDGNGKGKAVDIPDEVKEAAESARAELIEAIAETDDALLEKFFEEGTLSEDEIRSGLHNAVASRKLFPVTMSSALHGIGLSTLLDDIVATMPSPLDRGTFPATDVGGEETEVKTVADGPASALIFKTLSDPFAGKVSILRVVSGTLKGDSTVWNTRDESDERLGHLLTLQGKQTKETPELITGDIGGVAKLKHSGSGDTLCDKKRPVNLGWIGIRSPAISFAIEPKSKGDDEKIGEALKRLREEDPSLGARRDAETGEYLISGTGQLHVEIAVAKLKQRFHVEVILHPPKVPYRETIKKSANGHGRHKKQSGGRGQFADCRIIMEPLPRGAEFEFVDEIFGGSIPQTYRPAVEKGIQEARHRGYLAGFPVVDFKVRLKDGQFHDVDSSEMAFKVAGSLAFKDAMASAAPTIVEPMMEVRITTSDEFTGDVMGDLSHRRGRPQGMETKAGGQVISALVPMAEMLDYAPALTSMTQGRASFEIEFSHYAEVPRNLQEKIIADAKREKEEG
jgi:elongation factor G